MTMKKIVHSWMAIGSVVALGLSMSSCVTAQPTYNRPEYSYDQPGYNQPDYSPNYDPSYNQPYDQPGYAPNFRDELSQYGQWVQTPEYGMVWMPNVEPGFQPYATNGRWVVTEYGNTWVSDYAWGRTPFHYGRWYLDRFGRWAWVPGTEWGPAWVSWRSGGGYYGWAPLGPGINVNVNANIPPAWWVFVPQTYITSPRLFSYCVPRQRVVNVYQNTTIINNVYRVNNRAYAYGPRREEIETVTRQRVPVYRAQEVSRPGRTFDRDNTAGRYGRGMDGYSRPEYRSDRGTYNGNTRTMPTPDAPTYRQRGPIEGSRSRGPRYEAPSQPGQPSQPSQTPAPSPFERRESAPAGSFNRGNRPDFTPQRVENQQRIDNPSRTDQPRMEPQRLGGYEPRSRAQSPAAPGAGSFPGQRSGSRGPR
ncbi:DUF6600 domain-containing protein [Spirosoma montaniterrae]|uniref:Uncharacterized protein n=1 Tax=Spirosoma montaniterrae TaxID=1178516 RepID=A0A1P9WW42_9BACT|nr:DUF6600 domain-containing protein [Spirosoma montaniterrae]AQG79599.1 hypothetical protein AWR27_09840 [Spirosoma montaniterrae]